MRCGHRSYTPARLRDEDTGQLISRAEVAEIPYTAFTSKKEQQVAGRLVVRRIPEVGSTPSKHSRRCLICGGSTRFFTTVITDDLDTVAMDQTHRRHAIIEQVNADLKASALAHLPSGEVWRERGLARPCGDRVEPHPCCRRDRDPGGRPRRAASPRRFAAP